MKQAMGGSGRLLVACALCVLMAACAAPQPEPGAGPGASGAGLAGTSWRLVEFRSPDDAIGTVRPADPARYTLAFGADGRAALRLDCNRGSGTWTAEASGAEGGSLRFGPLAVTRAFCPPPSLDVQIARDAEFVRTYLLRDGRLHLDLMADGGTYVWEPAGDVR
jgi:heat shock protein HslJ